MKISQINSQNSQFPDKLLELDRPPKQLFVLGNLPKEPAIGIVGTRKLTAYGRAVTYQMASELARAGLVIVSGLAFGADAEAHQAALDAGGKTVAVLACGLDQIYPASHRQLAKDILESGGAIISEYPVGMPPLRQNFVARNRIVSGMSYGVLVTESPATGGSLLTANFAKDQNRIVMAVPGDITRTNSAGPNNLIRAGAIPVTSSTDVLQALDLNTAAIPASLIKAQNPHEAAIIGLLGQGINTNDALIEHTQLSAAEFAAVVSLMEITGKVRNLGGGLWAAR